MPDTINPAHYQFGRAQVIDITENLDFCRGSAIKYLARAGKKDDEMQDLLKAKWYVERAIERLTHE